MLIALDIETSCGVECTTACDHALDRHRGRVDIIGAAWRGAAGTLCTRTWTTPEGFLDWLKDHPDYMLVGHNLKFDLGFLWAKGARIPQERWAHDTHLLTVAIPDKIPQVWLHRYNQRRLRLNKDLPRGRGHRPGSEHSLKTLAPYYLGVDCFWEDPRNHNNEQYVTRDAEYTLRLFETLKAKFENTAGYKFYETKLLPWTRDVLLPAEAQGVMLDLMGLQEREAAAKIRCAELAQQLEEIWKDAFAAHRELQIAALRQKYDEKYYAAKVKLRGDPKPARLVKLRQRYLGLCEKALAGVEPLNLKSPVQLTWLLRDFLKLDITSAEDEDEESTDKAVLERLAATGRSDVRTFLEYREETKRLSSFYQAYQEKHVNSVLHTSFNPGGARTGRLSSSGPNLQQVPGDVHSIFRARPGHHLICRDAAGIEARLIALYTEDPVLYDIVANSGDIHGNNAKIFFGLECDRAEVKAKYPFERQLAKTVGFALFYGAGANRIKFTAINKGISWTDVECAGKLARFRQDYEGAFRFKNEVLDPMLTEGQEVVNLLGRPMKYTDPEDVYMKGFNRLIQSSASDLIIQSAWKAQKIYDERKLGARVLLLVHDEIVVEAPAPVSAECARILEECMTQYPLQCALGPVPLSVEGKTDVVWSK